MAGELVLIGEDKEKNRKLLRDVLQVTVVSYICFKTIGGRPGLNDI